jgi:phage repressor protein C with HTH and peptisase S24 domain/DNA-binding XRE family transcriptional regulator
MSQENLAPPSSAILYSRTVKINEWVKAARKHADFSQEKLGELLSCTKGNVSGWETGRHLPSFEQMVMISKETGYQLPQNQDMDRGPPTGGMAPILAWEHPDDLPPGEFVMIPRLSVQLSAGNGHEQIGIEFSKGMPQAFRAEWIREQKLKPNKLAAMTADGESMEPTIFHGDSLLVDTSQDTVMDGKVYALWYDGGERVKRLFRLPGGGLRIQSDNPRHHTIELQPEHVELVRVIGRVVHRSGKGGL